MSPSVLVLLLFLILALVLAGLMEIGHAWGKRDAESGSGLSTVEGAVFALVGLFLAFAFSGATDRLGSRRGALIQEANTVGTALLRMDLIRPESQERARDLLREYTQARVDGAQSLPDLEAAKARWAEGEAAGESLWKLAVEATSADADRILVLDSLNQMFDQAKVREMGVSAHLPWPILGLLGFLTGLASLLAGRAMAGLQKRHVFFRAILPVLFAAVLTVLFDLELPRIGFIQLSGADAPMESALQAMSETNGP